MVLLFSATLFCSAGLLFVLEPLVAKSLLPVAGGTAAVWITCAAFFQLSLLAGYLYAHALRRWLSPSPQAAVHLLVLAMVFAWFPLGTPTVSQAPAGLEAFWLFGRLGVLVGAPFVVLSATAPLTQHWFSISGNPSSRDPYFLYAASNAGSLLALLVYPFLIEPSLGLASQRAAWNALFAAHVGLLGMCAITVWRSPRHARSPEPDTHNLGEPPTARARVRWLALAAVPSSLLLSVTSYVSSDLAGLPLLWVAPLALYLVTFILAFSSRQLLTRQRMQWLQPFLLIPLIVSFNGLLNGAVVGVMLLHAGAFFVIALLCHQMLALARPAPRWLTEYYVWISAGGALGGLFNVLIAPAVFPDVLEYPLGIAIAVVLINAPPEARRLSAADALSALGVAAGIIGFAAALDQIRPSASAARTIMASLTGVAGLLVYSLRTRPLRFAVATAALACAGFAAERVTNGARLHRSFFGVHAVMDDADGIRRMVHGNTVHGAQSLAPERRREPLTYFHRSGPAGQFLEAWRGQPERRRVAVVGLGTGSLAAYSEPGEHWTFFEIDPEIIMTARDRGLFSYLADARGSVDVVLGDARQTLEGEPDGSVGVLVLDAFSSDSIPTHLLTREAFDMYLRKLQPHGVIAVHVSNRHMDIGAVVAATARACGAVSLLQRDTPTPVQAAEGKAPSHWMVIAQSDETLKPLARNTRWSAPLGNGIVWTDDWTSLWPIIQLSLVPRSSLRMPPEVSRDTGS